jgi:CYTH domain-containing protein
MEYERRFLVKPGADWREKATSYSKLIKDRYLACGRLRLRRLEDSETGRVAFKLTKKYAGDSPFGQLITSIWLVAEEYSALMALPGHDLSKQRYYYQQEGVVFSIDEFHGALEGLLVCEVEADSLDSLNAIQYPDFARWEVTQHSFFTGGALSRASREDAIQAVRSHVGFPLF